MKLTMHPIIFLWSHPRSMSTATERIMRERGDLECLHEPFLHYYYLQKSKQNLAHFNDKPGHPVSYQDTRNWILERANSGPVFAKDMSYYVMPELLDDADFCENVRHCFLIRHPLKSILSYYKLDPGLSLEEIGLQAQWDHFQGIEKLNSTPIVLEAEAIQSDARAVMRLFWENLGLDYREQAFDWSNKSMPDDWQYVKGWHANVSSSAGIEAFSQANEDRAKFEFAQICREAPHLQTYLDAHLPSYQALKARSLSAATVDIG